MTNTPTYDIAFVVEQVLGHITHGDNLRRHVPDAPDIRPHWVFEPYETDGWAARIPVYRSNWTVRVGLRSRRSLRRIRRRTDLDAIFFHTQVPAMLCADVLRRVPSVISLDATPQQYDELGEFYAHETGPAWLERLKFRGATDAFRHATHLVTWSAWAKDGLVDGYGVDPEKITVVPPGVTVDEWARPEPRVDDCGPVKILFVGGDLGRKGGTLLIEAARALRDRDIELHLATRDEVASEPGVFVHHGLSANSPELKRLYHDCDIFALPTMGDCLPMVLSEAGAAGLASVSTSVAAIPEVVRHGETGLIVPPGDLEALVAALRRLIDEPAQRRALGERAVAHIAESYDTAANTRRILSILRDAADRSGSTRT